MGATAAQVLKVVREELAELPGTDESEPPVKISVLPRK